MIAHRHRYALGTLLVRLVLWLQQPAPAHTDEPSVHDLVLGDLDGRPAWMRQAIRDRRDLGLAKYRSTLQVSNGRDPLLDAEQEAMDLVAYLRQAVGRAQGPGVRRRTLQVYRTVLDAAEAVGTLRRGR